METHFCYSKVLCYNTCVCWVIKQCCVITIVLSINGSGCKSKAMETHFCYSEVLAHWCYVVTLVSVMLSHSCLLCYQKVLCQSMRVGAKVRQWKHTCLKVTCQHTSVMLCVIKQCCVISLVLSINASGYNRKTVETHLCYSYEVFKHTMTINTFYNMKAAGRFFLQSIITQCCNVNTLVLCYEIQWKHTYVTVMRCSSTQ